MERLKQRIVLLWTLIMGGFAFHCIADLLPLFWSADIAADNSGTAPEGMLLLMMALSYLIPAIGILCLLFSKRRGVLMINTVLAVFTAVLCIFHLSELITEFTLAQVAILPAMATIAILLAIDSIRMTKKIKTE